MPLRVLDQRGRMVEAHRPVVQHRSEEGRRVTALDPGAGVGEQREAGGVRFGEAVQRERRDRFNDPVLLRAGDAVARHALAQLDLDLGHLSFGALESEGAAQLLGLSAGEARGDHRHTQKLLLEQRHAERALEHRLERGVHEVHRFPALAALQVRVHHLADDRAGTDDRHLHHDVVERLRLQPRQARHLGAALHLEHPDGVGFLERVENLRVVLRQVREVDLLAV